MSTTSLFVELLVIGFEFLSALVLALIWITGSTAWLTRLAAEFSNYSALAVAIVFAVAYFLGIISDKFAKWLLEDSTPGQRLKEWIRKKRLDFDEFHWMYTAVMVKTGEPMSDLLYARSKVRIFRASIIGVPAISIFSLLLLVNFSDRQLLWLPLLVGSVATALTVWGYIYNQRLYLRRLSLFYTQLLGEKDKGKCRTDDARS